MGEKIDGNFLSRRINVTGFGDKSGCHPTVAPQKYYVIFCERRSDGLVAKFDDVFGAAAEWSERTEERIWSGVGKFANPPDRAAMFNINKLIAPITRGKHGVGPEA